MASALPEAAGAPGPSPAKRGRLPDRIVQPVLWSIFFGSGAAGLGYEIVWTRMLAVGLGHELPSMLAVVAGFFGGLSLGAWTFDRRVSRSNAPSRWYAAFEAGIGIWGVASIVWLPELNRWTPLWIGIDPSPIWHWTIAFLVPFLALLPATVMMGATFPAFERIAARAHGTGRAVAGLYAANTAGAVAGVVVTTFWLVERTGYAGTLAVLAAINGVCAAAVLGAGFLDHQNREPDEFVFLDAPASRLLDGSAFASGLFGIGYQVIAVAVLARATENTVYSFAASLVVFLVGTAVGAALHQRYGARLSFLPTLRAALGTLGATMWAMVAVLAESREMNDALHGSLGGDLNEAARAELLLAAAVLLVPASVMGFTFSHLIQAARHRMGGVGRALGINTLGSSVAPLLFGVVLLPELGAKWTIVGIGIAYFGWMLGLGPMKAKAYAFLGAASFLCLGLPDDLWLVPDDERQRVVAFREGVMAAVSVRENESGDRQLYVNNRFIMGGTGRGFLERRMALLPLLLHPAPRRSLFLGVGAGTTVGQAGHYPNLDVAAAELLPEVVEVLPEFRGSHQLESSPNVAIHVADARRFVRASAQRYDVVVADLFHPARDGAGLLYTGDHYRAVRAKLEEGGLFMQWLPLYQMNLATLRTIIGTFVDAFPRTSAWLAYFNVESPVLGLLGSESPIARTSEWYRDTQRRHPALIDDLDLLALGREIDLFGCLLADDTTLRGFADGARRNSDMDPILIFTAPAFVYHRNPTRSGRLEELLAAFAATDDVVRSALGLSDAESVRRVTQYARARDLYLRSQIARHEPRHPGEPLELLLESVRTSPEFRTAYIVAVQVAVDLYPTDPETTRAILRELIALAPAEPFAGEALRQLFP